MNRRKFTREYRNYIRHLKQLDRGKRRAWGLWVIWAWLVDHRPVWCAKCHYVGFACNMKQALHQTGKVVDMCPSCYAELFHPWGGGR